MARTHDDQRDYVVSWIEILIPSKPTADRNWRQATVLARPTSVVIQAGGSICRRTNGFDMVFATRPVLATSILVDTSWAMPSSC